MTETEWILPNGMPLRFQDGDHVKIETKDPAALRFTNGYVRGYEILTNGDDVDVTYGLYSVGNHPQVGVREDRLIKIPGPFGASHGRDAHRDGKRCNLCGANV